MDDGSNGWNRADEQDNPKQFNAPDAENRLTPSSDNISGDNISSDNISSDNISSDNKGAAHPSDPGFGAISNAPKCSSHDRAEPPTEAPTETPTPTPINDQPPSINPTPPQAKRIKRPPIVKVGAERRDERLFQVHGLSNFLSTSRIPQQLDALVAKRLREDKRLDHVLIHGTPGSGTSLLAIALIKDYAPRRVIEIDAALGCDAELLRRSFDDVGSRGVIFIRHIDALDAECDQVIAEVLEGRVTRPRRPRGPVDPTESELDRAISASASSVERETAARPRDITLVGTAHMMAQVGYVVRTRVEHMFHLRDDPKALRNAVLRALRRQGSITVDPAALPQLERVLKTLTDSAEPITRAALLRSECEGFRVIDEPTMRSIIEEDLAARLPDEAYSSSLRRHLAGRRIEQVTAEELARLESETGWGPTATEAALSMMLREECRKRPA